MFFIEKNVPMYLLTWEFTMCWMWFICFVTYMCTLEIVKEIIGGDNYESVLI